MRRAVRRVPPAIAAAVLACAAAPAVQAQTPPAALDAAWTAVCAGAVPGSAFFQRCREILDAGPGSGPRRSEAALGNHLDTIAAQGRMADATIGDAGRVDWGRSGGFLAVTTRDYARRRSIAEAGYDGGALGLIAGVDRRFGAQHVLGLAANHQRESADFDAGAGRARSRHLGLIATYGGGFGEHWSLDAYAGQLRGHMDLLRRVRYDIVLDAGTPAQTTVAVQGLADAETDVRRDIGGIGVGWSHAADAWLWQLGAGVDAVRSRIDGYVEAGGAGLALAVDRQRLSSRQARVGGRATHTAWTWFGVLQPYLGVDLFHEFADAARDVTVAFAGDAARTPIRFATPRPDRGWTEATVGVAATFAGGSAAFVEYRHRFGHRWLDERALSFGFRVEFD